MKTIDNLESIVGGITGNDGGCIPPFPRPRPGQDPFFPKPFPRPFPGPCFPRPPTIPLGPFYPQQGGDNHA
jgi:hypothetical protein